jgi:ribosomal protein L29
MKKKELSALKLKTVSELKKMIVEKQKEASLFFSSLKAGKEKGTSKRRNLRRDIAQILTIIKEKEILEEETVNSEAKKE